MSSFTFLHAADLHLGSPLLGLSLKDEVVAQGFAQAARGALAALVDEALAAGVAFVVIAGDVYDGDWRDASTGLFFAQQMARLSRAEIPVYLIKGNHDAESVVTRDITLPPNVKVFGSRAAATERIETLRVAIHGRSFPDRAVADNWAPTYPEPVPGWFNIGLLHTSCDGRPGHAAYAPCSAQDLAARGYDYWALGHVHEYEVLSRDPWIVFPGNLQGRSVRECGPKGAVFVDVEDGRVSQTRRVIVDQARWALVELDIAGREDVEAVIGAIEAAFGEVAREAEGRLVAARLRLSGETALHEALVARSDFLFDEAQAAAQRCAESIWVETLRLETRATASSASEDLAGLDLAALLSGLSEADLTAEAERLAGELRGKAPNGASLAPVLEDMPALVAEARAFLLGNAREAR